MVLSKLQNLGSKLLLQLKCYQLDWNFSRCLIPLSDVGSLKQFDLQAIEPKLAESELQCIFNLQIRIVMHLCRCRVWAWRQRRIKENPPWNRRANRANKEKKRKMLDLCSDGQQGKIRLSEEKRPIFRLEVTILLCYQNCCLRRHYTTICTSQKVKLKGKL